MRSLSTFVLCVLVSSVMWAQVDGLQLYRHVFITIGPQSDTVYSNIELQLERIQLADSSVSSKINAFLEHTVAERLSVDEEVVTTGNLLDAAVSFESACRGSQEGDWYRSWDYWGATSLLYQTSAICCVEFDEDTYTGGAHPLHFQSLFNFDVNTGNIVPWEEMFADTAAFSAIAEVHFWKMKEEAFGSELANEEFFWGGEFYLPENIGFVEEGVLLLYNEYEVAPYVYGAQYCFVPYTELKGILKPQYLP